MYGKTWHTDFKQKKTQTSGSFTNRNTIVRPGARIHTPSASTTRIAGKIESTKGTPSVLNETSTVWAPTPTPHGINEAASKGDVHALQVQALQVQALQVLQMTSSEVNGSGEKTSSEVRGTMALSEPSEGVRVERVVASGDVGTERMGASEVASSELAIVSEISSATSEDIPKARDVESEMVCPPIVYMPFPCLKGEGSERDPEAETRVSAAEGVGAPHLCAVSEKEDTGQQDEGVEAMRTDIDAGSGGRAASREGVNEYELLPAAPCHVRTSDTYPMNVTIRNKLAFAANSRLETTDINAWY